MAHHILHATASNLVTLQLVTILKSQTCSRQKCLTQVVCLCIGVHIAVYHGGSMTAQLFEDYMQTIVRHHSANALFTPPSLLLLDRAASHKMVSVSKIPNVHAIYIPAGCTSFVQPLDVVVNKPFKSVMRAQWKRWMEKPENEHILTKKGHRQRVCTLASADMTFMYLVTLYHIVMLCNACIHAIM